MHPAVKAMISLEISLALRNFSRRILEREIQAVVPASGFSGADVWKITTPQLKWALRRWPSRSLPPLRIRGLHQLLAHLERRGLSFVATPVPSDSGETLIASGDRWWQLEPWLPGAADFHAHPRPERLTAALAALAQWHQAAATFVPTESVREWFGSVSSAVSPAVFERSARLQQLTPRRLDEIERQIRRLPSDKFRLLGLDLLERIRDRQPSIAAELSAMLSVRFALQPCLRDIWHDHVLFVGDEVAGLIDPSACRQENVATDLSRLIGSLVADDATSWQIALSAYRRFRCLTFAEEELVATLDRSGVLLSALTWLEWLFVERRAFANVEAVRNRLISLQQRLGCLDRGRIVG